MFLTKQQKQQDELQKAILMKQQKVIDEEHQRRKRQLLEQEALQLFADKVEEEKLLRAVEVERLLQVEEEHRQKALLHRPWGCNIPFSYLFHSRCRRLANQNPVFDLQSLVNCMFQ